jgi:hypothetical protein
MRVENRTDELRNRAGRKKILEGLGEELYIYIYSCELSKVSGVLRAVKGIR